MVDVGGGLGVGWRMAGEGCEGEITRMESTVNLDELLGVQAPAGTTQPPTQRMQLIKLRYTHEAMIDQMIANPAISQNALAELFGYTASWVSQVMASDAFQVKLAERTKEMVDPTIRASVEEQFKGMLFRSMQILSEKLNGPASTIPDQLALRTAEMSSRALGYGIKQPEAPVKQGDVHIHLEQLGENLTKLLLRKKVEAAAIDTTFSEIAPDEPPALGRG